MFPRVNHSSLPRSKVGSIQQPWERSLPDWAKQGSRLLTDAGGQEDCPAGQRIAGDEGEGTPWRTGPELIITDPFLGDLTIDDSFTLELLELLFPPEMRQRLPNGGWRKVSMKILIALLRCGVVRVAEMS